MADGEREDNVVLRFAPDNGQLMIVACLLSRWTGAGRVTCSITDEPPPEVAAAGHDRCIVPIQPAQLPDWLAKGPQFNDYEAILDDRERPIYAHLLAA